MISTKLPNSLADGQHQFIRMSLVNIWHLRKVAEASARPCDICYKLTSAVFITPDNQVIYDSVPSYGD